MPLTFNIRHLENKDLHLTGELPSDELELGLQDELIRPGGPLVYDLEVEKIDDGDALVQGSLQLKVEYDCARCLKPFSRELLLPDWACHLPLKGDDATPITNDLVNLTPYIREDILLALPQRPLCEPECRGLKPPANVDPGEKSDIASSAWSELDKLKL
jgi:uncharacterized metal-binding protein YceD (DUF177 family)